MKSIFYGVFIGIVLWILIAAVLWFTFLGRL